MASKYHRIHFFFLVSFPGYNFDLSPLIKKGKEKYEVSAKAYIYYLNICEKVQGTPCSSLTTGVCQTKAEQ